jgi:hypothetical protein
VTRRDYRDLVIEDLADQNELLRARLADLEADCRIVRELAHLAVHALHDVTVQRNQLRARLNRLLTHKRLMREAVA